MIARDFWRLFLKGLGVWLALETLTLVIAYIVNTIEILVELSDEYSIGLALVVSLILIGCLFLVLYLFVFRTEWLIDKFKLDQGFIEGKIDINISHKTFIAIVIATISGLTLISSLPALVQALFDYYQQELVFRQYPSARVIVLNLVKTVISIVCMTYSFALSGFFLRLSTPRKQEEI